MRLDDLIREVEMLVNKVDWHGTEADILRACVEQLEDLGRRRAVEAEAALRRKEEQP